jgi:hypothetical protein
MLAPSGKHKVARALADDSSPVYWTESGAIIRKVARTGGTPVDIATQDDWGAESDIAVDATSVYWINCASGTIRRAPK